MLLGHPDYTSESTKKPAYVKSVVSAMEKDGFVTDSLSAGESKFMVHTNTHTVRLCVSTVWWKVLMAFLHNRAVELHEILSECSHQ